MLKASYLHYATAHDDASAGAIRLRHALTRATATPVSREAVADLVVTCFDRCNFEVSAAWRARTYGDDWFEVSFAPATEPKLLEDYDPEYVGRSAEPCVAFALGALRQVGFASCDLRPQAKGWVVEHRGVLLATVTPLEFSTVSEQSEVRVARAFEGLLAYGDEQRTLERLRELPGLSTIEFGQDLAGSDRAPCGPVVLQSPRSFAKGLRTNVKDFLRLDLSQGHAQECVAALLGFQSWNEMIALEAQCAGVQMPYTVGCRSEDGRSEGHKHYRTQAAALWAYAESFRSLDQELVPTLAGSQTEPRSFFLRGVRRDQRHSGIFARSYLDCLRWAWCSEADDETNKRARSLLQTASAPAGLVTRSGSSAGVGEAHHE